MIRFLSILIAISFLMHPAKLTAQASPGKQKKTAAKKQVNEQEEKLEEIREDRAISNSATDTAVRINTYGINEPVKKYDTTLAPNDALTTELHRLFDEIKLINITLETARQMIAKTVEQNRNPELSDFYARFSAFLSGSEASEFYRNLFTKIYRKHYTLDEVLELKKFYQTNIGKKTMTLMNQIMEEAMSEGGKFGEYWAEKIYLDMQNEK